ncbi:MAG: Crp/Fnr family transcriptional regulator [Inquilinus sp.]|uniref:Crp/Fnr family transcriptional regulator n=1 Tax=Inquilinus sp. TaxID=1932117 RepID=UPI003F3DF1DA
MYEFVADQIFGLNGLVNLSNIVFLAAYSVRSVLALRILSLVSEAVILPYYYFQTQKLWVPICWGVAFLIVNAVRIVGVALERRPVILSRREEELHRVAFSSIDKRDFLRLVSLAQWLDYSPGEVILTKGQQISDAIVLVSGKVDAVLGSETRMPLRPGQLIGDVSAYSGLVSPVDVVVSGPAALAKWNLQLLSEFMASKPELRANLLRIVNTDLAAKLRDATTVVSGFSGEQIASMPPSRNP